MADRDLTPDMVFALLQSEEEFPVSFDDAWQWLGYKRKDYAKDALTPNFVLELDYIFAPVQTGANQRGGHNREEIWLTVDCLKSWGMMAGTPKGREIRLYFLKCEAELNRRIEAERQNFKSRIVQAFVSDGVVSSRPRFKDEFYELLYRKRGQGWEERNPKNRPPCVGTWTNQVVYDRFPEGVKDRLNEVNPRVKKRRKHKHHEHLKPMGSDHLDAYLPAVMAIARISPDGDWGRFMRNVRKGLPNGEPLQTSLLDLLEEYEEMDQVS